MFKRFASGLAGGILILTALSLPALAGSPEVTYQAWSVYWDPQAADPLPPAPPLEEISVFAYHFDILGNLIPANAGVADTIAALKKSRSKTGARTMITLVNDVVTKNRSVLKDPEIVHRVVATAKARRAHIKQISQLAESVDGIEVDYERVAYEDRAAFGRFIVELGAALRARSRRFTIVVQPRTAAMSEEAAREEGAATIDWTLAAQHADRVIIMAYLYSYSGSAPGSVAPTPWIREIADLALKKMPPQKVAVALHLAGFDWPEGQPGQPLEFAELPARAGAQTPLEYDAKTGSARLRYRDPAGKNHEVWMETAEGIRAKIQALQKAGVRHIALWRLGSGDPDLWK